MKKTIKNKKNRKSRVIRYGIWLWSEIAGKYSPTQHPLANTMPEATTYARKNLKLPENLSGKVPFEVRPETVFA